MVKVCVIGHFAFGENLLNGQTVKTKIISTELERQLGSSEIRYIDTHGGIKSLPKTVCKLVCAFMKCKNIIIMPAQNGLKGFAPLCTALNKIFYRKLHYVVIGGWLPEYLESEPKLETCVRKFDVVYVETYNMKLKLNQMGLHNVTVMHNCKNLNIVDSLDIFDKPYKLCTFSRVMREKGIEDAVDAVKYANDALGEECYNLDIYGQIDANQKQWFEELNRKFPSYVQYGGLVSFDNTTDVLKQYFALLFPTYYEGEGFAGTAIDAFAAGVPVIASDWKYNSEIIQDGRNGKLFPPKDYIKLAEILIGFAKNPNSCYSMRPQCISDAHSYKPDVVLKVLFDNLD